MNKVFIFVCLIITSILIFIFIDDKVSKKKLSQLPALSSLRLIGKLEKEPLEISRKNEIDSPLL